MEGYVEELKGHVSKSLVVQALHNCKLAPTNSSTYQWNAKSLGLPYFMRYPTIIFVIYHMEKVQHFSNKNAITLVRAEKGQ